MRDVTPRCKSKSDSANCRPIHWFRRWCGLRWCPARCNFVAITNNRKFKIVLSLRLGDKPKYRRARCFALVVTSTPSSQIKRKQWRIPRGFFFDKLTAFQHGIFEGT
jgi:hypothetical protein